MQKVIISDTSCLLLLEKLGALDLLKKLFGTITITPEVGKEFNIKLPEWFELSQPENKMYQKILEASLDKGEASAIALAIEHKDCLLIIDELKARKYAELLGLKITETLGVLIDAKLSGHLKSIRPLLDRIRTTNFRLSKELEQKALEKSGEM